MMGQLSGSTVIQNYQSIFYAAVGYTGRTGLLISGIYGFMGVFGQIAYLAFVADKWMRTRTLCKLFRIHICVRNHLLTVARDWIWLPLRNDQYHHGFIR